MRGLAPPAPGGGTWPVGRSQDGYPPARDRASGMSGGGSTQDRLRAFVAELEAAAREEADNLRGEARRQAEAVLTRVRELEKVLGEARAALEAALVEMDEAPEPEPPAEPEAPAEPEEKADESPKPAEQPAKVASQAGEGPRLIALNMMMAGSSREEVGRYLTENFELEDPGEVLDDVWSRAG